MTKSELKIKTYDKIILRDRLNEDQKILQQEINSLIEQIKTYKEKEE